MSNLFQRLAGRGQSPRKSLAPRRPYLFEEGGRLEEGNRLTGSRLKESHLSGGAVADDEPPRQGPQQPAPKGDPASSSRGRTVEATAGSRDATRPQRPPKSSAATVTGGEESQAAAAPIQPRPRRERATNRAAASNSEGASAGPAPDAPPAAQPPPLLPKAAQPRARTSEAEPAAQPPVEASSPRPRATSGSAEAQRSDSDPGPRIPEPLVPAAARERQSSGSEDQPKEPGAEDSGGHPAGSLAPKGASTQREVSRTEAPRTETVVRVTIGSLEVRAVTPQPQAQPQRPAPRPLAKPRTSLADYQKRRGGRG